MEGAPEETTEKLPPNMLTMRDLLDVAINNQDPGILNFNALRILVGGMIRKIERFDDEPIKLGDLESYQIMNYKSYLKGEPSTPIPGILRTQGSRRESVPLIPLNLNLDGPAHPTKKGKHRKKNQDDKHGRNRGTATDSPDNHEAHDAGTSHDYTETGELPLKGAAADAAAGEEEMPDIPIVLPDTQYPPMLGAPCKNCPPIPNTPCRHYPRKSHEPGEQHFRKSDIRAREEKVPEGTCPPCATSAAAGFAGGVATSGTTYTTAIMPGQPVVGQQYVLLPTGADQFSSGTPGQFLLVPVGSQENGLGSPGSPSLVPVVDPLTQPSPTSVEDGKQKTPNKVLFDKFTEMDPASTHPAQQPPTSAGATVTATATSSSPTPTGHSHHNKKSKSSHKEADDDEDAMRNAEDIQTLFNNLANVIAECADQKDRIDQLVDAVRIIESGMVNRQFLMDMISNKADRGSINTKVSYDEFGNTVDELHAQLHNLMIEGYQRNENWKKIASDLSDDLAEKLDKVELAPIRAFFKSRLKKLEDRVAALAALLEEPDAAGTRTKRLRDLNCISCNRKVNISGIVDPACLPTVGPSFVAPSNASHRAYDLHRLRSQRTKFDPDAKELLKLENQMKNTGPQKLRFYEKCMGDGNVMQVINRYIGDQQNPQVPTSTTLPPLIPEGDGPTVTVAVNEIMTQPNMYDEMAGEVEYEEIIEEEAEEAEVEQVEEEENLFDPEEEEEEEENQYGFEE